MGKHFINCCILMGPHLKANMAHPYPLSNGASPRNVDHKNVKQYAVPTQPFLY